MKKYTLSLLLSAISISLWAQSNNVQERAVSIESTFDQALVITYANQAKTKVEELFEYLKLYSNTQNNDALNQQLMGSMEMLLADESLQLNTPQSTQVFQSAKDWATAWKKSGFQFSSITFVASELKKTYWNNQYTISYQSKGKTYVRKMTVQLYFQPLLKSFGTTQQYVWDFKIGKIDISR